MNLAIIIIRITKVLCFMLKINLSFCAFFIISNLIGSSSQHEKGNSQQTEQKYYSESEQKIKLHEFCEKSKQGENIHQDLTKFLQDIVQQHDSAKETIVKDVHGQIMYHVLDFTDGDSDEDEYDMITSEKK